MSLRDDFEKLFPVPARVEFFPEENSYGSKSSERIFVRDAEAYRRRWEGFQAGHAAGLEAAEKACIVIEDRYDALNENGRANAAFACADAIRAMKGEVK